MSVTATIQVHEIVWTVPAVLALAFTLWMHRDVWYDWRAVKRSGWNGDALLLSYARLRDETLAVVRLVCMTAPGVFAMTQPPNEATTPPSVLGVVLTVMLLALPSIEAVRALWARHTRRQIRRPAR